MKKENKENLGDILKSMCEVVGVNFPQAFEEYSPGPKIHYLQKFDYVIENKTLSKEEKLKLLDLIFRGSSLLGDYSDYIGSQSGYNDLIARYQYSKKTKSFKIDENKSIKESEGLLNSLSRLRLGSYTLLNYFNESRQKEEEAFKDFIRNVTIHLHNGFLNPKH